MFSFIHLLTFASYYLVLATAQNSTQPPQSGPETGALGNASVVEDNPPDVSYIAILPGDAKHNNIKGSVFATANSDGIGVKFLVNFTNLPTTGGPFIYHLHTAPVPADGNCTGTLAHLDPFVRGEATPCSKALPQTCQVGDLSGKHGSISADPFYASYVDEFASTSKGLGSFFGNRSIVVHSSNKTRLTCANFTLVGQDDSAGNKTGSNNGSDPVPFRGSASQIGMPHFFCIIALLQFILLV